jgi:hypothetical protein
MDFLRAEDLTRYRRSPIVERKGKSKKEKVKLRP